MDSSAAAAIGYPATGRRHLVQATAEALRERIFAQEAGSQIGSLSELARDLGVGIVTVQQAARILEHEGLLEVRRGPGGGYYGRRPDVVTLERALAAYMRARPASWEEALDITSLLFNELCAAAAQEESTEARSGLRDFAARLEGCDPEREVFDLEEEFQNLLFTMVNRPLFELLTRVTLHFSASGAPDAMGKGLVAPGQWLAGRKRIVRAILDGDVALARFEADRSNRAVVLASLHRHRRGD
ncbi:GntR family transcriptional regulator [Novosphingobium album (ex Liu et al. 2023)]|uniref:GntR family transcriptional regulator n=1 Tax=Novosphingobium album (ex Liu et al. 2023) TaxID=3031130 RepID=A0ABT5WXB0_9SPHN|nr:GntR family transcriptional regulator [Novosphingobium album (ex Liu et al. 2023)]MDE8654541.1 GntR family transcriptional regulator [Novosphingobium album (ex Liu et al. 2023)]